MNALIINCSPVRTGATAEIVKIVTEQLSTRYDVRSYNPIGKGHCSGRGDISSC